ncbi:septum formation initiator family protein [Ornithinibacillus sp. L9]|uniref:Septum formation initiator family protein n=1 Tax=Ornithinibacillus caprae TaxID=2678566 RepID=A0A6N8FEF3_9BACI|nr:septum formation initiator family protein [Ornithinibacillus caprae]MUK88062.1 septum formation initiator family protein [Ornithinibacillus caprae]
MSEKKKTVARLDSNYMQKYDAYIERQKRKKKRLIRRLVLFSAIVALAIGTMTTYHVKQRSLHAEKLEEYQELEEQLAKLKAAEEEYEEEIQLLNDEEYILDIARTNYFLSKEGELIFKIPEEDPSY